MKKKSASIKTSRSAGPQSAQLDAVRKQSRVGQHDKAQARVAELRARYPDFKPLLALAWEVDDNAGDFLSASQHAWDWSRASPGSLAALEALRDSAFEAGFPALGASAMQKLAQAEGESFPDLPPLPCALVDLTFEQALGVDLSRMFLAHGRFSEAIAALGGIDHPSARNNLGLARFALGEIEAALAEFEANWRQDTRNLFALHHVARLRMWRSGRGPACELADALRDGQPLRAEDAHGKMFGLLLLGANDEAIDAWRVLRKADFWNERDARQSSLCAHFAGLAALRKGDMEAAGKLFSEAFDLDPDNMDADMASTYCALGEEVDAKAGEFHDWFPKSWLAEFRSAKGAHAQNTALESQYRACGAHADYLAAAAELGGVAVRFYAVAILKLRALDSDETALDTLRALLIRPCGPDKVRMDLNIWLQENGLVETGEPQQLLLRGEVKKVALRPTRLHAEPTGIALPAPSQARLEQMHSLLAQSNLQSALRIAEELAAAHPEDPILICAVASIKGALDHDLEEIELLFRRAAELDPTYLFAQAGLARIAARKGDLQHARELLKPLQNREEYHFSEWRAILLAEREIAAAQKDAAGVLRLDEALEMLNERFS